jgi:glycosyltransferase involved in cell wall biosynthesis
MQAGKNEFAMPEGISVIICCYNSSARITPTLVALQNQQLKKGQISWEVILVDNASADNTAQIAAEVWRNNPVTEIKILREDKPGLMEARRRGLEQAAFDIVSFIDDDNWVEPEWVQKVAEVFSINKKIGACGGKSEAIFEKTKPGWFDTYENSFAVGAQADQSGIIDNKKGFLWGAGLSFRKQLWQQLQQRGFKNLTLGREGMKITAGEDTEICYAIRLLGYHIYYRHDLTLKHFMPENRMNSNYLKKMFEGFGKAYARLNCYRAILNKQNFELHPWWYEWIVAQKNVIRINLQSFFLINEEKKLKAGTQKAYNKGYAAQVWKDKSYIKKYSARLTEMFKN